MRKLVLSLAALAAIGVSPIFADDSPVNVEHKNTNSVEHTNSQKKEKTSTQTYESKTEVSVNPTVNILNLYIRAKGLTPTKHYPATSEEKWAIEKEAQQLAIDLKTGVDNENTRLFKKIAHDYVKASLQPKDNK